MVDQHSCPLEEKMTCRRVEELTDEDLAGINAHVEKVLGEGRPTDGAASSETKDYIHPVLPTKVSPEVRAELLELGIEVPPDP